MDPELGMVVQMKDVSKDDPLSNSRQITNEIHDILHAYYKVARRRFIDCVRMQVADCMLVTGDNTPLKLFSAALVAGLAPDVMEEIAGEENQVKNERQRLDKEIKMLEKAKKIIN